MTLLDTILPGDLLTTGSTVVKVLVPGITVVRPGEANTLVGEAVTTLVGEAITLVVVGAITGVLATTGVVATTGWATET